MHPSVAITRNAHTGVSRASYYIQPMPIQQRKNAATKEIFVPSIHSLTIGHATFLHEDPSSAPCSDALLAFSGCGVVDWLGGLGVARRDISASSPRILRQSQ